MAGIPVRTFKKLKFQRNKTGKFSSWKAIFYYFFEKFFHSLNMREQDTVITSSPLEKYSSWFQNTCSVFFFQFWEKKQYSNSWVFFIPKIPFTIMVLKMLCLAEQYLLHVPPTTYNVTVSTPHETNKLRTALKSDKPITLPSEFLFRNNLNEYFKTTPYYASVLLPRKAESMPEFSRQIVKPIHWQTGKIF